MTAVDSVMGAGNASSSTLLKMHLFYAEVSKAVRSRVHKTAMDQSPGRLWFTRRNENQTLWSEASSAV